MQHTVEIPAPSGADTETVITALETAALFRSKGDKQEAMHWLRRAAESAGESGDDERALLFSRTVADLHEELEQALVSKTMPYPPPPSSRSSSRPPSSNGRASLPPRASSRPPALRAVSVAPRASSAPRASTAPASLAPRASTPPRPSVAPSQAAPAATAPVATAPVATAPVATAPVATAPVATAPAPTAPPASTTPLPAAPVSSAPTATTTPIPAPPAVASGHVATGARHAARVAVQISTSKAGVFEVRLLAEGESPRIGSSEAFLVMLDPTSTLLAR